MCKVCFAKPSFCVVVRYRLFRGTDPAYLEAFENATNPQLVLRGV